MDLSRGAPVSVCIRFGIGNSKESDVAFAIESLHRILHRIAPLEKTRSGKSVARNRPSALTAAGPNPQGKGLVGFLLDWAYSTPHGVLAKRAPQLLADYFTSLLVLSAAFKFKPVFGKEYYLYRDGDGWSLSLVSPDEWNNDEKQRAFVGKCVLQEDSTWSIEPSGNIGKQGAIDEALAAFYDGFIDKLKSEQVLEADLPFYEAGLPYYQRLFAAALSRSLKGSMMLGDQLGISAEAWLSRLPQAADRLLLSRKTDQ